MKMKIIADSGSTKTDWLVSDGVQTKKTFRTQGLNPVILGREGFAEILKKEFLPLLDSETAIDDIFFYGAGCTPEQSIVVKTVFSEILPSATRIVVESDLLGAARALCGCEKGIACILGTGSNSCLYDGVKILQNTPALGYILGDEGSGSVLGRLFLNAVLKGVLPVEIRDEFMHEYNLTLPIIINKVYREDKANRFLASIAPFVGQHIDNQQINRLVTDNFRNFLRINVMPYFQNPRVLEWGGEMPVSFVGSIAYYFREQLEQAATLEGVQVGQVVKTPMNGLEIFHS